MSLRDVLSRSSTRLHLPLGVLLVATGALPALSSDATLAVLATGAVVTVSLLMRLRAIDLVVCLIPIQTVISGVNICPADPFVPFIVGSILLRNRRGHDMRETTRLISSRWILQYLFALVIICVAGLLAASLAGDRISLGYAVYSTAKLIVSVGYLFIFYHFAVRIFHDGDRRLLTVWAAVATLAALMGVAGVLAPPLGDAFDLAKGGRANSTFGDANLFASYMIISLALILVLREARRSWPASAASVVVLAGLLFSGSRAAVPAVVLGALGALLLTGRVKVFRRIIAPLVACLLVVGTVAALFVPGLLTAGPVSRAVSSLESVENDPRFLLWRVASEMWVENPWIGVGIGQYRSASIHYAHSGIDNVPHSTVLGFLAETGIVGFLVFFSLPGAICLALAAIARSRAAIQYAAVALLFGLLASAVQSATINLENSRMLWAFLGIALAYGLASRAHGPEIEKRPTQVPSQHRGNSVSNQPASPIT